MSSRKQYRSGWLLLLAAGVSVLAGCDLTGSYAQRYEESLANVGKRAATEKLLAPAPTTIAPSTATIRLPSAIGDQHATNLPAGDANANPPFAKLPGLSTTLQRLLANDATAPTQYVAAYAYLGAVPIGEQPTDALLADLQKQVGAAFAGATWQDAQVGNLPGKVMVVSGPQVFASTDQQGTAGTVTVDGRFELYCCTSGTHTLVIAFRVPTAEGNKWDVLNGTQASIGSVQGG
jgi:hypothetical protein